MGLTKQYLRYSPAGNVNIINSEKCNSVFVTLEGQEGRFVATGACEHVYIWDLRLGEKAQVLSGEKVCVTRLAASPNKRILAAGYADGTVKTFDLRSGELISSFKGHNSQINALAFDKLGHRLASGAKDTDIIIWDIVAERGLCRLVGHKGEITQVAFMQEYNILISSSKDSFIKFWDLDTEHNFKTLTGHRSEVWDFVLAKDDKYLISGSKEDALNAWRITSSENSEKDLNNGENLLNIEEGETDDILTNVPIRCVRVESIMRSSKGRVTCLKTDNTGRALICQGKDNTYDLFYFLPEDQVAERVFKKLKKKDKSQQNLSTKQTTLRNEIKRLQNFNTTSQGKSVDLVMGRNNELRICAALNNNSIELYSLVVTEKDAEIKCLRTLNIHGHRTDVRAVAFSSDNQAFVTVSGDSIKLWNRSSLACLRTVECDYALSVTFVPGDRHLIVGLKKGAMLIVDISSGDILEKIEAHEKELWSLCLFPDLKGVVSGGGDKTVKFWQFELVEDSECKSKVLSVCHTRTLKLEEGILSVKISPNNRFIAVSLLDCTVKIFFLDSFKFFISLYGHKLPVLCMDISSDSTLIVTGSADRNIKIWGMDFGDCHKSLFAHDDSITGISFVPRTHYFFSCGKDGRIKEWDADIYTKIITLQGHMGEVWSCAVSPNGEYVLSCGSDKVTRVYKKTQEILVLEDEEEQEREEAENAEISNKPTTVKGQKQQILPTRKTLTSEKGAESILECLEISKQYMEECATSKTAQPLPLLMKAYNCKTTHDFLLQTVKNIRASDLDEALLILPYSTVCEIIRMLPTLLKEQHHIELVTKLALTIIRMYHSQIITNTEIMIVVNEIETLVSKHLNKMRDTVGFNLYGMFHIQRIVEDDEGIRLFKDATVNRRNKKKIKANKEKALKRAIMAL